MYVHLDTENHRGTSELCPTGRVRSAATAVEEIEEEKTGGEESVPEPEPEPEPESESEPEPESKKKKKKKKKKGKK